MSPLPRDWERLFTSPGLSNAELADALDIVADWYQRRFAESNPATLMGQWAPPVIMEAARRLRAGRIGPAHD